MTTDGAVTARLEALEALEAVRRLKYRYLRCLDTKDWAGMAEVLAPDCSASYGGGAYRFAGRDEILAFLERTMASESVLSSHRVHHPEIDVAADGRSATGTWAMDDVVLLVDLDLVVRGSAYYEDRYERDGSGDWQITHTGYRRIYEQLVPAGDAQLTASWWGTDGRSTLPAG